MAFDLDEEQRLKVVDRAVSQLMEHFDSVRIFVTKHDNQTGMTGSTSRGNGNFYSQFGQVTEWMSSQDEMERDSVRIKGEE